jgi:hypothetical protein
MTSFSNMLSAINGLSPLHRIAMVFWCMDRAFATFDAVTFGRDAYGLPKLHNMAMALWNGPGESWSMKHLGDLKSLCTAFETDLTSIEAIDYKLLGLAFSEPALVSRDHIYNAMIDTVSVVYHAASMLPEAKVGNVGQAMEAYYDIFYQPTWDHLTEGKVTITLQEMAMARQQQEAAEPLRTALQQIEAHLRLLGGLDVTSFDDVRLRGR